VSEERIIERREADAATRQRLNEELYTLGLGPLAPPPVPTPGRYIFPVCTWVQDPESIIAEIKRQISDVIGERTTGSHTVTLEFSDSSAKCSACEKDDRREWTEPEEHTCAKHNPNARL
jgi:hypothetical protein